MVRKNLLYLRLYASQIVSPQPIFFYCSMMEPQIAEFYKLSSRTYEQLGNTVFKDVYATVGIIEAEFVSASPATLTRLRNLYSTNIDAAIRLAAKRIRLLQ
jgi:hypothetical protein